MDLYHPFESPPRGAVLLMHGGGFTGGSRDSEENRSYALALAERGYLAVAVSYRQLSDRPVVTGWAERYSRAVRQLHDPRLVAAIDQFGAEFTDAVAAAGVDEIAAVRWLEAHAQELGFDPKNVALFGASAGAIAALTNAYGMGLYGEDQVDVACVIELRGLLLRPDSTANPFHPGDPPLLMFHGEEDQRVPLADAEQVFSLAVKGGTPVELYTAGGYGHDLGGAAFLRLRVDRQTTVLDRLDRFLGAAFGASAGPARSLRARLLPATDAGS